MARAHASNRTGSLGALKVITFSLQDAYPLLQFGTKHLRPILKNHWSKSAKHSPLSRREKRAQTSESAPPAKRAEATESAKEKENQQIAKGCANLLGTLPPKATYACARTICERGARGACMRRQTSSAQGPLLAVRFKRCTAYNSGSID